MNKDLVCPVCSSSESDIFINRIRVPVHQNFIFKNQSKARNMARGDIRLAICNNCGFVYNYSFDKSLLQYNECYDNTQSYSRFFQTYIDGIIQFLTGNYDISGKCIVEVGCGKGTFLKQIVEATNSRGFGFDPSYEGPESILDGRLKFERCFYDNKCSNIYADVVICRHVIEHEADPVNMIETIRAALANSPKALVFFETPNVEWIMNNKIVYDIFYEHCSYFCDASISYLFERCGFKVEQIKHAFNGQYMWVVATLNSYKPVDQAKPKVESMLLAAEKFRKADRNMWLKLDKKLMECQGNVAVWGAGAKGVTLANTIDPEARKLSCVIDINPNKIGGYLPGTGHKVISYRDIPGYDISDIIVLNSNYMAEINELIKSENIRVNLVNGEEL